MAATTAGRRGNEISSKEAPAMSSGTWSLINASLKVRMLPFLFLQTFIIGLTLSALKLTREEGNKYNLQVWDHLLGANGTHAWSRSCPTSSEMHTFGDKQRCPQRSRMIYQVTAAQPPTWIHSLALQPAGISLIPHFHQADPSPGAESWPCSKPLSQGQWGEGRQSNRPPVEPLYCTCWK